MMPPIACTIVKEGGDERGGRWRGAGRDDIGAEEEKDKGPPVGRHTYSSRTIGSSNKR